MNPDLGSGWVTHMDGVRAWIESLGPEPFSSGILRTLFIGFRPLLVRICGVHCTITLTNHLFGIYLADHLDLESTDDISLGGGLDNHSVSKPTYINDATTSQQGQQDPGLTGKI